MADSETHNNPLSSPSSSLLCNSHSDLLCQEDHSCFDQDQDQETQNPWSFVSEDEECFVENIFQRESFFGFGSVSVVDQLCSQARSEALQWIFDTREVLGFNFRTAYLAITFFDRFLSKRHIDNEKVWAMRLLSVACLSLAAKIEELEAPMLSEFPARDFDFESKTIRRMELLVLSTLEWKMGSMTPFSYLNYFINKLCSEEGNDRPSKGLVISSAVESILAMIRETNSIESRPSIVAACAVLVASNGRLSREAIGIKMSVIKFLNPQEMENVYSCCNLLQEIEKRRLKTPQFSLSSNVVLSIVQPNSPLNSAPTTKRRLNFNESDQSNPVKKLHRT